MRNCRMKLASARSLLYADQQMTGNPFGDAIRSARQARGLSLRELSEKVPKADGSTYSAQYLNDMEHGRRKPPDEQMIRDLARALDLDPEVLLALAGREPQEIRDYLTAMPEEREVIGRLFRKARERKFTDWEALEEQIEKEKKT